MTPPNYFRFVKKIDGAGASAPFFCPLPIILTLSDSDIYLQSCTHSAHSCQIKSISEFFHGFVNYQDSERN